MCHILFEWYFSITPMLLILNLRLKASPQGDVAVPWGLSLINLTFGISSYRVFVLLENTYNFPYNFEKINLIASDIEKTHCDEDLLFTMVNYVLKVVNYDYR